MLIYFVKKNSSSARPILTIVLQVTCESLLIIYYEFTVYIRLTDWNKTTQMYEKSPSFPILFVFFRSPKAVTAVHHNTDRPKTPWREDNKKAGQLLPGFL
jgi:hypothetical protein